MKKQILFAIPLGLALLFSACEREFPELHRPLEIQGTFDPVFGLPLAKMTADVGTMVGMFDTNQNLTVFIGEDDVLSFRYDYSYHTTLDWTAAKGKKGTEGSKDEPVRSYSVVTGTEYIDLFRKFLDYDANSFQVNEFLVTLEADVQAFVNNSFQAVLADGVNLSFDSLVLTVNCVDGYREMLPMQISSEEVSMTELIEKRHLEILKDYNLRHVAEHKPYSVDYSVRLCISMPVEQLIPGSTFHEQIQYIGVDSIVADINSRMELPLTFYSHNVTYVDTLPVDLSSLNQQLSNIENGTFTGENYSFTLNDDNCYLAFVFDNGLPVGLNFNLTFLDENNLPLLTTAFTGDQNIFPAPVVPFEGHPGCYRAEGSTPSQFRMKLTLDNLKQLGNCHKIAYTVVLNTALSNPPDFVAVREDDRIAIRSYAVISPHANFTIPVTLPEIPFFSK